MHLGPLKQLTMDPLPFVTEDIGVSMVWHERSSNDPAHRWLRQNIQSVCTELKLQISSLILRQTNSYQNVLFGAEFFCERMLAEMRLSWLYLVQRQGQGRVEFERTLRSGRFDLGYLRVPSKGHRGNYCVWY